MEDWNSYRLVLALHRAGTLRGAASLLDITHTTVARRLEQLERRHQAPVFERIASGYRTTPLGNQLVTIAEQMERLSAQASRVDGGASNALAGPLTLSLSEALMQYLLMEDLAAFQRAHPDIQLQIHCSTSIADLDHAEADVVIRTTNRPPPHLVGRRFGRYGLSFYAHEGYLAATPARARRWIAPALNAPFPDWLSSSPYPHAPVFLSIDDIVCRFKAIEAGLGMGRAACFMAEASEKLVRLKGAKVFPQAEIWVLTHPDIRYTPRVKALTQFLYDTLARYSTRLAGP